MLTAIDLTPAARAELIAFCAGNLKPDYDPEIYAAGLIDDHDLSADAHFEIGGFHTKTGNPVTIAFGDESLIFVEFDDAGNQL